MLVLIVAFIVSLVPSIALYLWLKRRMLDSDAYRDGCRSALIHGLLTVFPVIVLTPSLLLLGGLVLTKGVSPEVDAAYHDFIGLALAEELAKYLMFRRVLEKAARPVSWLEMIAFMAIVGIGFGLAEDLPYAFMTNPIQMLVRGITIGHGAYGFIMGYLMGKGRATGDRKWSVLGFVIPWFTHGLYDFGLSEAMDPYFLPGFISLGLAVADFVIIVCLVRLMRKARNDERYTSPLA